MERGRRLCGTNRKTERNSKKRSRSRTPTKTNSISPRTRVMSNRKRARSPSPFSLSRSRSRSTSRGRSWLRRKDRKPNSKSKKKVEIEVTHVRVDDDDNKLPQVASIIVKPKPQKENRNRSSDFGSIQFPKEVKQCRDYDEKGVCIMGELCPYDHGVDPVIIKNIGPTLMQQIPLNMNQGFNPYFQNPHILRPFPYYEYHPDNPSLDNRIGWPQGPPPFRFRHQGPRFFPQNRPGPHFQFPQKRELINVPVISHAHNENTGVHQQAEFFPGGSQGRSSGGFDHRRLGIKIPAQHENSSLIVRKIPLENNNIQDLNGYFLRFGKILNIHINFDNDPESALVTYSNYKEAQCAIRCTDAVLNNRFIHVLWYSKAADSCSSKPHPEEDPITFQSKQQTSGFYPHPKPEEPSSTGELYGEENANDPEAEVSGESDESVFVQVEMEAYRNQSNYCQEKIAERKKILEELKKRRLDQTMEQIGQQKLLISKLETKRDVMTREQRDELMQIIKSLQQSIEDNINLKVNDFES